MKMRTRRSEEPEINVTSLIDVVLLLVVFFMLSSSFTSEGRLHIRLPHAVTEPVPPNTSTPLVVTVSASGSYWVNGQELVNSSPEALQAAVLKIAGDGSHDAAVTIRADGRATHQSVVSAMDVLGRLGFVRINIATMEPTGAGTTP